MENLTDKSLRTGNPYIIEVTNTSDEMRGATIFMMADIISSKNRGFEDNGSLITNDVIISSGISGVTYQHLCCHTLGCPFAFREMRLCFNQNEIPKDFIFTLNTKDTNGNQALRTIVSNSDNTAGNQMLMDMPLMIDAMTGLNLSSIPAKGTITIFLYMTLPNVLTLKKQH